jgi:NDP-sugar pyrophosphorylase family protein
MIKEYIGNGEIFGLKISYSFDGEKLLGTGGAIKNAMDLLDDTFFVMYGDSYLNIDFNPINEYFEKFDKSGLMTVFRNENKWDKSNIILENGNIIKYDKKNYIHEMKFIDYGLGILKKNAFNDFKEKDVFDLSDLYVNLIKRNGMLGFEVKERFYEIGSIEGLKETTDLLSGKIQSE